MKKIVKLINLTVFLFMSDLCLHTSFLFAKTKENQKTKKHYANTYTCRHRKHSGLFNRHLIFVKQAKFKCLDSSRNPYNLTITGGGFGMFVSSAEDLTLNCTPRDPLKKQSYYGPGLDLGLGLGITAAPAVIGKGACQIVSGHMGFGMGVHFSKYTLSPAH